MKAECGTPFMGYAILECAENWSGALWVNAYIAAKVTVAGPPGDCKMTWKTDIPSSTTTCSECAIVIIFKQPCAAFD